jgi:predicted transcriptional regulator
MPKLSSAAKKLPPYDLRAEREKRELTQAETAQLLFTTQSTVARWEDDGQTPQIHREYWRLYWANQKPPKVSKKANKETRQ